MEVRYAIKQCPRDSGTLTITRGSFGEYLSCLNCGFETEKDTRPDTDKPSLKSYPIVDN